MPTPEPEAVPSAGDEAAVLAIFAQEATADQDVALVAVQLEQDGPPWSVTDGTVVPA